jgi:hypothetical protein
MTKVTSLVTVVDQTTLWHDSHKKDFPTLTILSTLQTWLIAFISKQLLEWQHSLMRHSIA